MRTYLDHNATTPLRPQARKAMLAALDAGGNASSIYSEGRAARATVENARKTIASQLGVIAPMVIFTGVGTEANNYAIKGAPVERIVVSATEHSCVLEAARATGKPVETVPVNKDGVIDLSALEKTLAKGEGKALVCLMLANNETGTIQPVREAAVIAHDHDALIHCDAVQALGKIPVNFGLLGVDMMTLSAHKVGGPQGTGALILRDGLVLEKLIHGGGQELGRRGGTE
ncbi:MAG TPA: aminotransferase class V-fold PLP-dependent enzyme, partial [Rhizobiales bacterium]|nr:aminotransferase class V-fold PLP-dependent enzyme [Hyphomicrobiales bacterium]